MLFPARIARAAPKMPAYEGRSKAGLLRMRKEQVTPSFAPFTMFKEPLLLHRGNMQYVYDDKNKEYLVGSIRKHK